MSAAGNRWKLVAIAAAAAVAGCGNRFDAGAPHGASGPVIPRVIQNGHVPITWVQFAPTVQNAVYQGIVTGPDSEVWFADQTGNSLDQITMAGTTKTFALTDTPYDVAVGADKKFYVGTQSNVLVVSTAGVVTPVALPGADLMNWDGLTVGPDGNVWFLTSANVNVVTPAGTATAFPYPSGENANVYANIAAGSDGNLWFTEYFKLKIGSVNPTTHVVTEFDTAPACGTANPNDIVAAPDGNLYFDCASLLNKITTAGAITSFPNPFGTSNSSQALAVGPDNNVWFISYAGIIGEFNWSNSSITTYQPLNGTDKTYTLTQGPDGNMWSGTQSGHVDVYVLKVLSVTPSSLTFTGKGQQQNLTVHETKSYKWKAFSSNGRVATVAPGTNSHTFVVTSVGSGTCTVTIKDHGGNFFPVSVTVP